MTQRSGWRPEHAVLLALLTAGADLLLALLLLLGVFPVSRWVGIPVLIGGAVAALAILAFSRKLRREQRPEWLETQAWRKGLLDKLHEGEKPRGDKSDPRGG
jgi:hypothetical protein